MVPVGCSNPRGEGLWGPTLTRPLTIPQGCAGGWRRWGPQRLRTPTPSGGDWSQARPCVTQLGGFMRHMEGETQLRVRTGLWGGTWGAGCFPSQGHWTPSPLSPFARFLPRAALHLDALHLDALLPAVGPLAAEAR